MTKFSRRDIVRAGGATALATGAMNFIGIPALADYAAGPAVRRNAFAMAANDPVLRGYRRAIKAMRALPNNNPCSWYYQAAIHGTTDPAGLTAWNTCHNDPTFFWAWHRMYLYWFERIVRKYSGMYDWALPFWDWTNPAERAIPAPFRVSTDAELYEPTRNASMNGGGQLSTSLGTSVSNAMMLLDYFSAQSGVNGPHGSVHIAMGGNFGAVVTAAQDPLFWLHHSEVDRQWNQWLAQGGGRSSPVGDTTWRNLTYTFFDECCNQVSMKGCDVLRAAKQLSYTYEGEPPQVEQYCPLKWKFVKDLVAVSIWRGPFPTLRESVRLPLPPRDTLKGDKDLVALAREQKSIAMKIGGVEAASQPGVDFEVYLGPKGLDPDPSSPYFVGIFGLFSGGLKTRKHHYSPADFVFPVSRMLAAGDADSFEILIVPATGRDERPKGDNRRGKGQQLRAPRAAVPVTIGEISFFVDASPEQPPRDEQEKLRQEELRR